MARHAQPAEVAYLKGADRKNPNRYQNKVPKSALPLGRMPVRLSKEGKKAWKEIERYALPGVLTGSDRLLMEMTSNLWAQYLRDPDGIQSTKLSQLIGCLARLGLSPADRQKLDVGGDGPGGNPFNAF